MVTRSRTQLIGKARVEEQQNRQLDPHAATVMALQPRRLKQILAAVIIGVTLALVLGFVGDNWLVITFLSITLALLIAAFILVQTNHISRAAGLMLFTLTGSMCGLIVVSEGIHDTAVLAFPGILIFASMFGTRRLFVTLLALMCAALVVVVTANINGWHANTVKPVGWSILINVLSVICATAFFVWLMACDLRKAMERMQEDNERIRESHARIEVLANRDSLTNLPNRALARDRLGQIIATASRSDATVAVLFLDLDNFKTVNDSLGHSAGDALLCDVADRLQNTVRECDTVSRQGGDEFLIILGQIADSEAAASVAVKLLARLATPFQIEGLDVTATGSVGIAMYPRDGSDADTLLKHADLAMYRAKEAGRNTFQFFNAEMNSSVIEDLHLATGVRLALINDEFQVHYQPQIDLTTGRIVGAEALLRWNHPSLGYIPPVRFIPVAERSGLINEIGAWVIHEVCRQTKAWQELGLPELLVAINVSPVQFRRDDIEREVANGLTHWNLSPTSIELELTESLLMADSEHLSQVLDRLRAMGLKLSIDDFGTGYSNLGYLKRFDVARLKIDQSFVRRMLKNKGDDGIVQAIIEMAHCLNLEVVAEGVEDATTMNRLRELGCEFAQGYHWSPALPANEFQAFLEAHGKAITPNPTPAPDLTSSLR